MSGAKPDHNNPWSTLSTRMVYENPWISLREDQVLRPDGKPGIYGVVHFRNHAVGVLPVDNNGNIWMVGQYRYPLGRFSWEIPEGGGILEDKETPEDTARRELGLIAGKLEFLATSHLSNSVSDELAYIFRATELIEGPSRPEGTEQLQIRVMPWDEVWGMLQRSEITDSMTVIAILHEALRRGAQLS